MALATSSGVASFLSAIVDFALSAISSSSPDSAFFGVIVNPGATALTLTDQISETSFIRDRRRPVVMAPFAAA